MLDMQSATPPPPIIHREDYRPPDWLVPDIALDFRLDPGKTLVSARLKVVRNGDHAEPLRLDGEGLKLIEVKRDGVALESGVWRLEDDRLVVPIDADEAEISTLVEIEPEKNSQLMGLYASGGILCTQCEAQGFRRITFFPDRPDVLSRYSVLMEADQASYPVLLANGDCIESGEGVEGRHWARWEDPWPKPCYLFALVAGDLAANRDSFVTMSGKTVDLAIWVREADIPKTGHAMAALKDSMAWDERVYGREYDLSQFNIVAVSDFNFGAMENKSLNIFNSRYILADAETATDMDFDAIAGVVAHEYFHNWSGNRVTCRDWFQLSLKEGFTVFRDQSFSADQGSAAVARIGDVRTLRAAQFPEDAGPLAHPVRPESYIEISNFYTATVYNKGAELIRMMHTILGEEGFRKGSDLYFERHDGEAATCEAFVQAMEDATGADLAQFRLWYAQSGTPKVTAKLAHDAGAARAVLTLEQTMPPTPGQSEKQPMAIPLKTALLGKESGTPLARERLVMLTEARQDVVFDDVAETPILSINRNFTAPVVMDAEKDPATLAFLSAHDDDPFARYEAMQQLMVETIIDAVSGRAADHAPVIEAVRKTLADADLDKAFVAEAVLLPSESFVGDQMLIVDPEAIHQAREALRRDLGSRLEADWRAAYAASSGNAFEYSPAAKALRRLRTVALGYIAASGADDAAKLAFGQFESADNMTDRQGALGVLANGGAPERVAALDIFYNRYRDEALVLDKWFTVQAFATRDDTAAAVEELAQHPDFTIENPNRLRALVGAFGANQRAFHLASGRGYAFLADYILKADAINPQTAARLLPPLGRWRRFDEGRGTMMRAELERILAAPGLSKDVYEQASKSLA
ncbi:aminopeptidase N [Parasphingopyxis marina]|uniref:Aminopeptidase N n=1 Tax=Parasphingopyxis marina TaxID=2761622 RepID=A0A842HUT6_9SPHN|nr:aminopeptidase N [Parasphingopyxis marina]MBC2776695.1 aminopeptidase N [Parasphingopyxis marina]